MQPLPDYEHALATALTGVDPLGDEVINLDDALGRRLASAVVADRDLPPFDRATMDGYAVRAADFGSCESFNVVGNVAAGSGASVSLSAGEVATIATGAPVPASADAVLQHELSDRQNPVRFTVDEVASGRNIHRRGEDATAGQVIVESGTRLAPHHLGIMASVGAAEVTVARQPRVVILTSGDEVKPVDAAVEPHQIRNSNAPMLRGVVMAMGCRVVGMIHVEDDPAATRDRVGDALAAADIVLTTGGISAGARDFLPDAFETHSVVTKVKGAAIQPGKPIFVGRADRNDGPVHVVGLPGNPVSVLATAHLFVGPLVRTLQGVDPDPGWRDVTIAEPVGPNPRRQAFRPARWRGDGQCEVIAWAGSGDLVHTASSDGLAALPIQENRVEPGTNVQFLPWAWHVGR